MGLFRLAGNIEEIRGIKNIDMGRQYKRNVIVIASISMLMIYGCSKSDKNPAPIINVNSQEEADVLDKYVENEEQTILHTGISTEIIKRDEDYFYMDRLEECLDQKQFAPIKIDYKERPYIFEGDEAKEELSKEDWDLVLPLYNNLTLYCGYCKIDYNNDGIEELLFRNISNEMMEVTGYTVDPVKNEINGQYDLMSMLPGEMLGKGALKQLWFEKIGDEVITICMFREADSNEFSIYSYRFTTIDGNAVVELLESREVTVVTELADVAEDNCVQDIFDDVFIDLTSEKTKVYLIPQKQLNSYQKDRVVYDEILISDLPQELVEILKKALETGQISGGYVNDILEDYEDNEHIADSKKICEFLDIFEESTSDDTGYLADLDHDGQDELILYHDWGGSIGYTELEIWKKNENGIAEKIGIFPEFRGYTALLCFEGNYYYVVVGYNYYSRETDSLEIFSFQANGTIEQHRLTLENLDNKKEWNLIYCNENISEELKLQIKDYLEKIQSELEVKTVPNDDYELFHGQAEIPYAKTEQDFSIGAYRSLENCVLVDFDNDGERECITRRIWYPGSLNSQLALISGFYKKYDSIEHTVYINFPDSIENNDFGSYDTVFVQIWFEKFGNQIYTFLLKRINFKSDYILEISLIEGDKMYPMVQYLLIAEKQYSYEY